MEQAPQDRSNDRSYDPAAEVVQLCQDLIGIDTSNYGTDDGPGERKAAEHVAALLDGKDVLIGVIDVATNEIETAEQVAATIEKAMRYVPKERIIACTNCGMAPMRRDIALKKLEALGRGAELARRNFA